MKIPRSFWAFPKTNNYHFGVDEWNFRIKRYIFKFKFMTIYQIFIWILIYRWPENLITRLYQTTVYYIKKKHWREQILHETHNKIFANENVFSFMISAIT